MTALVVHALHYGLFAAGLVTVAVLAWTVHRGRRADAHDERVRQLRGAVPGATPADEHPAPDGPPSAGEPAPPLAGATRGIRPARWRGRDRVQETDRAGGS